MLEQILSCLLYLFIGSAFSCPLQCSCRNKIVTCSPGLSHFPMGTFGTPLTLSVTGTYNVRNQIGVLRKRDLHDLETIQRLFLSYGAIQTIENDTFTSLKNLISLDLSYNNIKIVSAKTLSGLENLYRLDLSGNTNCRIHSNSFNQLKSIGVLLLAEVGLSIIPKTLLSPLSALKRLDFHGNRLPFLDWNVFNDLGNFQYLDISNNLVSSFVPSQIINVRSLRSVNLENNPWRCDCNILWLNVFPEEALKSVVCDSPSTLKYQSFINIPQSHFGCINVTIRDCKSNVMSRDARLSINLWCDFQSPLNAEFMWIRPDGKEIRWPNYENDDYIIFQNGTLIKDHASQTDHGNWTAILFNPVSRAAKEVEVISPSLLTTRTYKEDTVLTTDSDQIHSTTILLPYLSKTLTNSPSHDLPETGFSSSILFSTTDNAGGFSPSGSWSTSKMPSSQIQSTTSSYFDRHEYVLPLSMGISGGCLFFVLLFASIFLLKKSFPIFPKKTRDLNEDSE